MRQSGSLDSGDPSDSAAGGAADAGLGVGAPPARDRARRTARRRR